MAEDSDGQVGADIEFVCRKASMLAIREYIENQKSKTKSFTADIKISKRHFQEALKIMAQRKSHGE
jgi:transitional endoplasmic reticulum ATPase